MSTHTDRQTGRQTDTPTDRQRSREKVTGQVGQVTNLIHAHKNYQAVRKSKMDGWLALKAEITEMSLIHTQFISIKNDQTSRRGKNNHT